jgi:hypothetical protein
LVRLVCACSVYRQCVFATRDPAKNAKSGMPGINLSDDAGDVVGNALTCIVSKTVYEHILRRLQVWYLGEETQAQVGMMNVGVARLYDSR